MKELDMLQELDLHVAQELDLCQETARDMLMAVLADGANPAKRRAAAEKAGRIRKICDCLLQLQITASIRQGTMDPHKNAAHWRRLEKDLEPLCKVLNEKDLEMLGRGRGFVEDRLPGPEGTCSHPWQNIYQYDEIFLKTILWFARRWRACAEMKGGGRNG